jgi:hypothetical protein
MEIRSKKQRKHDADLKFGIYDVSVKCDYSYPYSWVFGKNYPNLVKEEFWKHDNHFLIPVHKVSENTYEVLGLVYMNKLVEQGFFSHPKNEYLRDFKSCLYFEDTDIDIHIKAKGIKIILK